MFFDEKDHRNDEDYFSHTRMTFGDHIEALRWHLWRAIVGFFIAMIFAFFIGAPAIDFIGRPIKSELKTYQRERLEKIRKRLVEEDKAQRDKGEDPSTEVQREIDAWSLADALKVPRPNDRFVTVTIRENRKITIVDDRLMENEDINEPTLKGFTIMEAVLVWFKVCIYIGLVLGSPWIFWEIWSFVAAGLYPHEKKLIHVYLPFSLLLFLIGVVFCQFVVIPKSISVLLGFNEWLNIEPELRLNDWLSFAIILPLIFGISFQIPLVMLFCERLGIVSVDSYRSKRTYAWFGLGVLSVLVIPTPDGLTTLFLLVPLMLLYELGILLCKLSPGRPLLDFGAPDESEEMVEV
jgi:sec-independent protein translocase protein TatC